MTNSDPLTGPTDEERAEYLDSGEWVDADFVLNTEVTYAKVELTFEQTHLLVEAGQLVGESAIEFMRNAALARAEELLTARSKQAESPVAGGS